MPNLIAAVIVAVCLPNGQPCDMEVPHSWKNPTAQDLHQCAAHAEILMQHGGDARCEVAYGYALPADGQPQDDAPIPDLADRAAVEEFLRPLDR